MFGLFFRFLMKQGHSKERGEAYNLSRSPHKVLFTASMLGMGEVVFFSMSARIMKENSPNLGISFLTKRYSCELLQTIPEVDERIPVEHFYLARRSAASSLSRKLNWLKMILFLRRKQFDVVAINSKSRAFTILMYAAAKLSGTKKVILMFPHLMKYLQSSRHVVESYKASLRDGGFKFDEREKPTLEPSAKGRLFAQQFLQEHGIFKEKHTVVGFCPMSLAKIKEWSANNFAELGNKLLRDDPVRIILFGYDNPEGAQRIAEKMQREPPIVI